jgi:hypothetical protein
MNTKPFFSSLALAAALAAPVSISMVSTAQAQVGVNVKIYDRDHKDYHVWDDREDKAYRAYLVERHREYVPYAKIKREDQRGYWNWRHEHPDEHR